SDHCTLINGLGPTESTLALQYFINKKAKLIGSSVPVGFPVADTEVLLLNEREERVALYGEIAIRSRYIAPGYWMRPEETERSFLPDPEGGERRIYKTGDIGRVLPDGSISFVGRKDFQVKIRGYRIELGEIETVLGSHLAVAKSVVMVREDIPGEKQLAAYIVFKPNATVSISDLRNHLKRHLPDYMIPTDFLILDTLPLTPNGKIDRHLLPVPERNANASRKEYVAPRNAIEIELADIWQKILNIHPIGVNDNFFELGGHSLLAVSLMAQIKNRFGKTLPLTALFQGATIENLAILLLQHADLSKWTPLVKINANGTKLPFFCVHPAGGEVLCYYELARLLGEDQPFYGLQAAGLVENQEADTTIEEMATRYINALRDVQHQGPYLLGGWSLGGKIAMEMAQQLEKKGEKIALLALFDTYAPLGWELGNIDDIELLSQYTRFRRLPITRSDLEGMNIDEQLNYIVKALRIGTQSTPDLDLAQIRRFYHVYKSNLQASSNYVAKTYTNQITVFRTEELPAYINETSSQYQLYQNPTMGWDKFCSGPIAVHTVSGNHHNIVLKPHVDVLARQLKQCILRAQGCDKQ
ncbi:MAG: thioesterase domain-containing protein, partial [Acidobacteriota bacterium]